VTWSRRKRYGVAVGSVLIALTLIGCGMGSSSNTGTGSVSQTTISASPSPAGADSPSPTVSPTPESTHTKVPTSTPTAPPPPPPKPGECPRTSETVGKSQSPKVILAELKSAANIDEYEVAKPPVLDPHLNGKEPVVRIPLKILKAVAAQESGWTSNCVSSDRLGYGTMQMSMAATDSSNGKLGTGFSRMDPKQNILVGNEWLEYLTVHFGIEYFHNDFNLLSNKTVTATTKTGTTKVTLRDAVFAAYNTGLQIVDRTNGKEIYIGPQGQAYASSVNGLMSPSQPCQKTWGR
jgi:transglycosylase-like protein with SLT domain